MAQPTKLFELIEQYCTADQIQDLLRERKKLNSEVRIGSTKSESIENLRQAVDNNAINVGSAYNLLRDSEENGRQHVFYYKPRTKRASAMARKGDTIAEALYGPDWRHKSEFPRYDLVPDKYVWTNFRGKNDEAVPGKPHDWIAKIYGLELRWVHVDDEISTEQGRQMKRKVYVQVSERVVCLARWSNPDLLEIRVARSPSRQLIGDRLKTAWKMLEPALDREDFEEWDLLPARVRILREFLDYQHQYALGDTGLVDSEHGAALFRPQTVEEDLFSALDRREAIEAFLSSGGRCRELVVTWKPNRNTPVSREIRTLTGGANTNEVLVFGQTSPKGHYLGGP